MTYYKTWTKQTLYRKHVLGYLIEIAHGENVAGGNTWRWSLRRGQAGATNEEVAIGWSSNLKVAMGLASNAARVLNKGGGSK